MTPTVEARIEHLDSEPLRVHGPRPGAVGKLTSAFADVWARRQLLDMLVRRELKARYKDSTLGFVWSMMRPLAMLLIYYVALGQIMGAARQIPDFAIFVYTGLTAWGLFSEAVTTGTASIVGNAGLIKKVYLPREIFPLAAIGSALFNFAVQLGILTVATVALRDVPTGSRWLFLPLSLAVIVVWALGWSLLLSAVNVFLRDIQYLVEIALMIAFWLSPIVYSWTLVDGSVHHEWLKQIYLFNPATLAILGFQKTYWVNGGATAAPAGLGTDLLVALGVGAVFLVVAQQIFARLQGNFAQEI